MLICWFKCCCSFISSSQKMQGIFQKFRAVFHIGQKGFFYEKRAPKISPNSALFLSVLHQNKTLYNCSKREQRSIVERNVGLEYALKYLVKKCMSYNSVRILLLKTLKKVTCLQKLQTKYFLLLFSYAIISTNRFFKFRYLLNFTTKCIGGQIKALSFLICTACDAKSTKGVEL